MSLSPCFFKSYLKKFKKTTFKMGKRKTRQNLEYENQKFSKKPKK